MKVAAITTLSALTLVLLIWVTWTFVLSSMDRTILDIFGFASVDGQ